MQSITDLDFLKSRTVPQAIGKFLLKVGDLLDASCHRYSGKARGGTGTIGDITVRSAMRSVIVFIIIISIIWFSTGLDVRALRTLLQFLGDSGAGVSLIVGWREESLDWKDIVLLADLCAGHLPYSSRNRRVALSLSASAWLSVSRSFSMRNRISMFVSLVCIPVVPELFPGVLISGALVSGELMGGTGEEADDISASSAGD